MIAGPSSVVTREYKENAETEPYRSGHTPRSATLVSGSGILNVHKIGDEVDGRHGGPANCAVTSRRRQRTGVYSGRLAAWSGRVQRTFDSAERACAANV